MKRLLLSIFALFLGINAYAMDAPLGSKRLRSEEQGASVHETKLSRIERSSTLELVPEVMQEKLKKYMSTAPGFGMEKLYNVARNIRNLRIVSKADRDWIDEPKHMDELIRSLAQRYTNNNTTQVVLALNTEPAYKWLKNRLYLTKFGKVYEFPKEVSNELISLLMQGHTDAARALLKAAKDYLDYQARDSKGNTILNAAVSAGDFEIFETIFPKSLVEINQPNDAGITPIINSIERGYNDIALKLLKAGAVPLVIKNGKLVDSALLRAAAENNMQIAKELLKDQRIIDQVNFTNDNFPWNPLAEAAMHNNYELFKLLLAIPKIEVTPEAIYWAIAYNQHMLKDLLTKKDIHFNESSYWTDDLPYPASFGLFARQKYPKIGLPYLDDNTTRDRLSLIGDLIDINSQDNDYGITLLMKAVEQAKLKTIEKLLELGADVTLADGENKTALDYAKELKTDNKERIIKLLQAAANKQIKK